MELGVFLPVSGRAAGPDALTEAARTAEAQGFAAVWSAERIVQPAHVRTPYPYDASGKFIVPPDRPFLDALTCLAYLAACTTRIKLGISVTVLPYHHPLRLARVVATLDTLSNGRFLFGVGVGWMREEFNALGVAFDERGRISDEQLRVFRTLWSSERASFEGTHYHFQDTVLQPRRPLPIWVGGEGKAARRRAGQCGDYWFPYFVRITPAELRKQFEEVRMFAAGANRPPETVRLAACTQIEVTRSDVPQEADRLRGSPQQLAEALRVWRQVGVEHLALQFIVGRWPDRKEQIAQLADVVLAPR